MPETLRLAADFPVVDRSAWLALVAKVLNGADFERRLVSRSYDDLPIQPLYTRADAAAAGSPGFPGFFPYLRGADAAGRLGGWDIRARVAHPDPAVANAEIRADLAGGATSLLLRLDGALAAGGGAPEGIVALDLDDLDRVLEGVALDRTPIALEGTSDGVGAALLAALWRRRGLAGSAPSGAFGMDPLGFAAQGHPLDLEAALRRAAEVAVHADAELPRVTGLMVDGHPYHAGDASSALELAAAMATGVDYLRLLERHGLAPQRAVRQIAFRFATDTDIFTGIAKLRAARLMWARIAEASGADAVGTVVTAMTAGRMLTRRDPYVNLLRCTLACFAAALGGAQAITVLPFDHALGLPDEFARRLARNTQLVLMEESGLGRVLDPLGGAGFVEALTRQLAREAWSLFQTIDGGGGMAESLRRGAVQEWVAASRAAREANVRRRRDAIVGVSEFPDLGEVPRQMAAADLEALVERAGRRLATARSAAGLGFEAMVRMTGEGAAFRDPAHGPSFTAIPPHRLAEGFEDLRDRSERLLASEGRRPRAFLCCLGGAAGLAARAGFAASLFASGGIEAVGGLPLASIEAVAAAFAASGARIAALCAADDVDVGLATAAARALKAAGCERLWAIGRPAALAAPLTAAGVDGFVQQGDDVLAVLDEALTLLETAR